MPITPVVVADSPCLGPYSHAVKANGLIFVSGQLGMFEGKLLETVELQTEACLKNLEHVLQAAGSDLNHCVKCQVFLKSMNDFAKVNEVYAKFFTQNKPARICIEVARLPKDALVEIDAVAAE